MYCVNKIYRNICFIQLNHFNPYILGYIFNIQIKYSIICIEINYRIFINLVIK